MTAPEGTETLPTAGQVAPVAEFRLRLRRFQHETERVARDCGLTPGWYLLMLQIKGSPDLTERTTVTALAQRLQLAQSSVTELVARAEQAGLIEREPSPNDARVAFLRLSAQGERSFARAFRDLAAERQALREAIAELED
ncbi:MAG TPA: helix-turn-helix domain-containing protein [Jiangellaceae bacterium]|nr:helix-turn-helix domain-containing protein [Jiangellaceae bacterium]